MKKPNKKDLVERDAVVDLLTDDEVSKVGTAESAVRLVEGDEFVDLERLDEGVRRADGVPVHMGTVVPRKFVHEQTWGKIAQLLAPSPNAETPTLVGGVMTRDVVACRSADSLNRAAQIMWENDCGIVPVLGADDRVIGVVTDRDICMAAYTNGAALSDVPVSTAWSNDLVACRPTDSLELAERNMRAAQVRRVVVTDDFGQLVGLLSLSDLARQRADSPMNERDSVERTLEAVSRPRGGLIK